jgi:hypothetical protein
MAKRSLFRRKTATYTSLIWKHAEGKTLQEVAERVSAEYEISVEAARADVDALVTAWQQKQLVILAAEATG